MDIDKKFTEEELQALSQIGELGYNIIKSYISDEVLLTTLQNRETGEELTFTKDHKSLFMYKLLDGDVGDSKLPQFLGRVIPEYKPTITEPIITSSNTNQGKPTNQKKTIDDLLINDNLTAIPNPLSQLNQLFWLPSKAYDTVIKYFRK